MSGPRRAPIDLVAMRASLTKAGFGPEAIAAGMAKAGASAADDDDHCEGPDCDGEGDDCGCDCGDCNP